MQTTKICWGCMEARPLDQYWRLWTNPDHLDNWCRDCKVKQREQYEATPRGLYETRARLLSTMWKPIWFPSYDKDNYKVDHKFSIHSGYQCDVPLAIIGNRNNLQLLTTYQNRVKGNRCSVSKDSLYETYLPCAQLERVAALLENCRDPATLKRWTLAAIAKGENT